MFCPNSAILPGDVVIFLWLDKICKIIVTKYVLSKLILIAVFLHKITFFVDSQMHNCESRDRYTSWLKKLAPYT